MAGQSAYAWPEDLLMVLRVTVAGQPWQAVSRETVERIQAGELALRAPGVWYEAPDEAGVRRLHLYPAPDGASLSLEWVYDPPPLKESADNEGPEEFPAWFHPKLLHFAAEDYYESVEDNPELAEVHKAKSEAAVAELLRFDYQRRSGDGNFTIPILGVTA